MYITVQCSQPRRRKPHGKCDRHGARGSGAVSTVLRLPPALCSDNWGCGKFVMYLYCKICLFWRGFLGDELVLVCKSVCVFAFNKALPKPLKKGSRGGVTSLENRLGQFFFFIRQGINTSYLCSLSPYSYCLFSFNQIFYPCFPASYPMHSLL